MHQVPRTKAANDGKLDINIDLQGSFHAGMCVGLYIGTTKFCRTSVGIGAEAYIGPKITGTIGTNFNIPPDLDTPTPIAYNMLKNRQVTVSWCSIELALNWFKETFWGKAEKNKIADMNFDLDPISMSILPEFDAPDWTIPEKESFTDWTRLSEINALANVTMGSPSGNSLLPILPGIGIYDEEEDWWYYYWKDWKSKKYWMGTKDDPEFEDMNWDFDLWIPNKKYKLYPLFQIPGINYAFCAEPYRSVVIEDAPLTTYDCENVHSDSSYCYATLKGSIGEKYFMSPALYSYLGFVYDIIPAPILTGNNGRQFLTIPREMENTSFSLELGLSLDQYPPGTTIYYRSAITSNKGIGRFYGEVKSFTVPEPD